MTRKMISKDFIITNLFSIIMFGVALLFVFKLPINEVVTCDINTCHVERVYITSQKESETVEKKDIRFLKIGTRKHYDYYIYPIFKAPYVSGIEAENIYNKISSSTDLKITKNAIIKPLIFILIGIIAFIYSINILRGNER